VSGSYRAKVSVVSQADAYSNQIQVTASSGGPTPMSRINGSSAGAAGSNNYVPVCPDGAITLDGSQSTCATNYFLSVQLADLYWNRQGPEAMRWLTASDYQKYGPISGFNVKKFAEDQYFRFVGGQYYRVKLAVGPGWQERTQLIYVQPPAVSFTINGSSSPKVDSVGPAYAITMNCSGTTCGSPYFLSVQLSDQNFNRYGPEAMKWLTSADFSTYGPINNLNVKRFAQDRGFSFVASQYYRVKLAIGPNWIEDTKLVYIKP
jgi:hypothetical protein